MTDEVTIPTTMKRLVVTAPGQDVASCTIEIQEVPVPVPGAGEVLIKVAAAAINPSDYGSWYRCKPEHCPVSMGKEGSGTVVATGGGNSVSSLFARHYACPVGTKVGFVGLPRNQGAYSEYVVASAVSGVFSLPSDLPVQDAASFFVNPYTALAIFDTARAEGTKAFVHTAAASQLGQMIVKLSLTPTMAGMEVINVVRREEQAELLREIGAKHIVVTGSGEDDDSWKKELASKIKELGATVAFDAVAGRSTGDLLDALPKKGTVYVYGGLAGKVGNIDPMALIYHGKKVKGFFLSNWIAQGGTLGTVPRMMKAGANVNSGLNQGGWSSTQFKDTTLENAQGDISTLLNGSITGQKLRIRLDEVV